MAILSILIAFVVVYSLILPAIAIGRSEVSAEAGMDLAAGESAAASADGSSVSHSADAGIGARAVNETGAAQSANADAAVQPANAGAAAKAVDTGVSAQSVDEGIAVHSGDAAAEAAEKAQTSEAGAAERTDVQERSASEAQSAVSGSGTADATDNPAEEAGAAAGAAVVGSDKTILTENGTSDTVSADLLEGYDAASGVSVRLWVDRSAGLPQGSVLSVHMIPEALKAGADGIRRDNPNYDTIYRTAEQLLAKERQVAPTYIEINTATYLSLDILLPDGGEFVLPEASDLRAEVIYPALLRNEGDRFLGVIQSNAHTFYDEDAEDPSAAVMDYAAHDNLTLKTISAAYSNDAAERQTTLSFRIDTINDIGIVSASVRPDMVQEDQTPEPDQDEADQNEMDQDKAGQAEADQDKADGDALLDDINYVIEDMAGNAEAEPSGSEAETTEVATEPSEVATESSEPEAEILGSAADTAENAEAAQPEYDAEEQEGSAPAEHTSGNLTYEDAEYQVTLRYGADARIPEDAVLSVREVRRYTSEYNRLVGQYNAAYPESQADIGWVPGLAGDDTERSVSDRSIQDPFANVLSRLREEKTSEQYLPASASPFRTGTQRATLLDITILDGDGNEIEPAAPVQVDIQMSALEKVQEGDVTLIHFEDGMEEIEGEVSGDMLTFETDSFSVYGLFFTVDFSYSVNGQMYDFSLPGGEKIALSDLIEVLGIIRGTKFESAEDFLAEVENVEFSDSSLVKVSKSGLLGLGNDWIIESLRSFDTQETLRIEMTNGDVVIVNVTDSQNTTNLNQVINVITIGADIDENGNYQVKAGKPYNLHLEFKETDTYQIVKDGTALTYTLPQGVTFPSSFSGTIQDDDEDNREAYEVNYTINTDGTITFTYNIKDAEKFAKLAENKAFIKLDVDAIFDGSVTPIEFSATCKADVDSSHDIGVNKSGYYDASDNKMHYTVSITSQGINTDINISDVISGTALTLDQNSITETSAFGATFSNKTDKGFSASIPKLMDGEIATIQYTASVDLETLKGEGAGENGKYGTLTTTGNSVSYSGTGDSNPDNNSSTTNEDHSISFSSASKSSKTSSILTDGKRTIEWKIEANKEGNQAITYIKDTMDAGSTKSMDYSGEGIHVVVKNAEGSEAASYDVAWGTNGLPSLSSDLSTWTYNIPTNYQNKDYSFEITYTTTVNVANEISDVAVKNSVETDYGKGEGTGTAEPDPNNRVNMTKTATNVDLTSKTVDWDITFQVPMTGLSSCVIEDTLPMVWKQDQDKWPESYKWQAYYDELADNPYYTVDGLLDGETCTPELVKGTVYAREGGDSQEITTGVKFTFKKDNGSGDGLYGSNEEPRTITIHITTKLNDDWLKLMEEDAFAEGNGKTHTNTAKITANGQTSTSEDTVDLDPTEPSIIKKMRWESATSSADWNQSGLPIYQYYIYLYGISEAAFDDDGYMYITDTFDSKYMSYVDEERKDEFAYENMKSFAVQGVIGNSSGIGRDNENNWKKVIVSFDNDAGTVEFKIHRNLLDKMGNGSYYPEYSLSYYLQIKDFDTFKRMPQDAIAAGGTLYLKNTAYWAAAGESDATVDYEVPVLSKEKSPNVDGQSEYTFTVKINEDGNKIGDTEYLTITDTCENLTVDYDSIRFDPESAIIGYNHSGYTMTYLVKNETPVTITYKAKAMANGAFSNTVTLNGQSVTSSGTADVSGRGSSGFSTGFSLTVLKHKYGNMMETISGVQFKLYEYSETDEAHHATLVGIYTTDEKGQIKLTKDDIKPASNDDKETRSKKYVLEEVSPADGYEVLPHDYYFTLDTKAPDYGNYVYLNGDTMPIANTPETPDKLSVTVEKTWNGATDAEKKAVTVHLYQKEGELTSKAEGVEIDSYTLSSDNGWTYTFSNLEGGKYYYIEEDAVAGFKTSYSNNNILGLDKNGTITVTNTRKNEPGKTDIEAKKVWVGSESGDEIAAPEDVKSVTVKLGREVMSGVTIHVMKDNGGEKVPEEDFILYGVEQGSTITATYTGGSTINTQFALFNLNGNTWEKQQWGNESVTFTVGDGDNNIFISKSPDDRDISHYSFAVGNSSTRYTKDTVYNASAPEVVLNASDDWATVFSSLPLEENGNKYRYYVEETLVTYADGTTKSGSGLRTEYHPTYSKNGGTAVESADLAYVNADGVNVITVSNRTESNEYSLTLRKTFTGNAIPEDKSGITFTVTGPDGFSKTVPYSDFTNGRYVLSSTADGITEGTYTVTESQADAEGVIRTTTYTVNSEAAATGESATVLLSASQRNATVAFTNDYYQNKTKDITVFKTWDVDGSGEWPDDVSKVTVELYANNVATGKKVELTKDNPSKSFENLPDNDESKQPITYSVKEISAVIAGQTINAEAGKIGDYTITVSSVGSNNTATITNSKTTPKTGVTVKKSWSNADGSYTWPAGLEVDMTLYKVPVAAGAKESEEKVTGNGITNPITLDKDQPVYTWENIPVLDAAYKYVVKEEQVAGYTIYAVQEDGTSSASDTAAVVNGVASFTNKENDNGKVAIQVTKNIQDTDGQSIDLFSDVTNKFTIKTNTNDKPDNVVGVNKGSYTAPYANASGYAETAEEPSTFDITVEKYAQSDDTEKYASSSTVLISNRTPGMYTITEDKTSIPDQIIDKDGKVWTYKETQILTEYAWRSEADGSGYHYSAVFNKDSGDYTGIPEIAGSYGADLYNGRLDFVVNNIYEPTDETVDVDTLNIQLNKAWNRGGNTEAPTSGSVTFELHQIATTTVTTTSEGNSGEENDNEDTDSVTIYLYEGDGKTLISQTKAKPNDQLSLVFELNEDKYIGLYLLGKYSEGQWGYEGQIFKNGSSTGTCEYTLPATASGSISFKFDNGITKSIFNGTPVFSSGSDSGNDSSSSTTFPSILDPAGSGFPKTITLTAADAEENVWKHLEKDLLSKTVSVDGNTTKTTTYQYYLVETERTGLASAYTTLTYDGWGDKDHPISTTAPNATVTVSATNSTPKDEDKFITVHKKWIDQDGNPITNHPDEIFVDVYRVKLPVVLGNSGDVAYVTTDFDKVFKKDGNNSTVEGDVVFEYHDNLYYVAKTQKFNEGQIDDLIRDLDVNGSNGDFIVRLTNTFVDIDIFKNIRPGGNIEWITKSVQNGSLCYYNDDLYVFIRSSSFNSYGDTQGPASDTVSWHKIGKKNIVAAVPIELPTNEELTSEEEIRTKYLDELYKKIDDAMKKAGVSEGWPEKDRVLEPYLVDENALRVTDIDEWKLSLTAVSGYVYFFFEQPVPGFTTLYGNEEHGNYDTAEQIKSGESVYIQNKTTVGSLSITKNWTVEDGEQIPASVIYAKVYRNNIDITNELAADAAKYGLTDADFYPSAGQYYLKVPVNDTVTLRGLDIAPFEEDATEYQYVIQERGYGSGNTADYENDVWDIGDIFESYSTTFSLRESAGTTEEPNYQYVEKSAETSTGSGSAATPVGAVTTTTTTNPETGEKETNTVFTAGKGEVTINNATESLGSVKVTKTFSGIQASQIPDGFMITATWKDENNADPTRELTISGTLDSDVTREGSGLSYTWTISDLPKGTEVTFTEEGYEAAGYTVTTTPAKDNNGDVKATATAAKEPGTAAFVNTYIDNPKVDIKLLKVDGTDNHAIAGAKFSLHYCATETGPYTIVTDLDGITLDDKNWFEVPADGLTIRNLEKGFYKITEEIPPSGYVITEKTPIAFEVTSEGTIVNKSSSTVTYGSTDKSFTVPNTPGRELPSTGSIGTNLFYILGSILILGAGLLLWRRRRLI